jgi:hypothetical protein
VTGCLEAIHEAREIVLGEQHLLVQLERTQTSGIGAIEFEQGSGSSRPPRIGSLSTARSTPCAKMEAFLRRQKSWLATCLG